MGNKNLFDLRHLCFSIEHSWRPVVSSLTTVSESLKATLSLLVAGPTFDLMGALMSAYPNFLLHSPLGMAFGWVGFRWFHLTQPPTIGD